MKGNFMQQVPLRDETHALLKKYCASKHKFLYHVVDQIIRSFLETQHLLIESEGNMIIEGEEKRPRTIVEVIPDEEEEEPRRSLKDLKIVRKGNRYILRKREARKPVLEATLIH